MARKLHVTLNCAKTAHRSPQWWRQTLATRLRNIADAVENGIDENVIFRYRNRTGRAVGKYVMR
jgi:hypothetical protein